MLIRYVSELLDHWVCELSHWTKISFKKNQRIYAFTNKTAWNAGEIRETITLPIRAAFFGKAQTAEDSEMFYDP